MPLQNKRSDTPGARTNLIPGEIAVQRADERLILRAEGRRVEVDVDLWARRAVPAVGSPGAPLQRHQDGVVWAQDLVPVSMVAGLIQVDLPPAGYAVPGLDVASIAGSITLEAGEVIAEPFYVASDAFTLTALMVSVRDYGASTLRIGIATAAGEVLIDESLMQEIGGNVVEVDQALEPGLYYALLWASEEVTVDAVEGYRAEQGWSFYTSGEPRFVIRLRDLQDLSAGLVLPAGEVTRAQPGEPHAVLMQWSTS